MTNLRMKNLRMKNLRSLNSPGVQVVQRYVYRHQISAQLRRRGKTRPNVSMFGKIQSNLQARRVYGQADRYNIFVSNDMIMQSECKSDGYRQTTLLHGLYHLQGKDLIHSIEADSRLCRHVFRPSHAVKSCHLIGVWNSRSSCSEQSKKFPNANESAPLVTVQYRISKRTKGVAGVTRGLTISGDSTQPLYR